MSDDRIGEIILELERLHTALTTHEKDIARYTKTQTYTNIVAVFISLITTVALLFLTYSQSKISENQFLFETRKSSPKILATVLSGPGLKSIGLDQTDLDTVKIKFEKNESEINDINVMRDYRVTKTIKDNNDKPVRIYTCIFRTTDFTRLIEDKNNTGEYSYYLSRFKLPSSWNNDNIKNAEYAFENINTIVRISYQDVLGVENVVIYYGVGASLFRGQSDTYPDYGGEEIVDIKVSDAVPDTDIQKWKRPSYRYRKSGCQHLLGDSVLISSEM